VAPLILLAHEWSLVQAIEAGSNLHFQTSQQQPEIRAQALIDIILGKDITPPEETAPAQNSETKVEVTRVSRPVAIRSAGIRFANAKITGDLNLQDASGPGGSMLPRLKMVNCSFEKPIRLQRVIAQPVSGWLTILDARRVERAYRRAGLICRPCAVSTKSTPRAITGNAGS